MEFYKNVISEGRIRLSRYYLILKEYCKRPTLVLDSENEFRVYLTLEMLMSQKNNVTNSIICYGTDNTIYTLSSSDWKAVLDEFEWYYSKLKYYKIRWVWLPDVFVNEADNNVVSSFIGLVGWDAKTMFYEANEQLKKNLFDGIDADRDSYLVDEFSYHEILIKQKMLDDLCDPKDVIEKFGAEPVELSGPKSNEYLYYIVPSMCVKSEEPMELEGISEYIFGLNLKNYRKSVSLQFEIKRDERGRVILETYLYVKKSAMSKSGSIIYKQNK